jgi:hypothetical protein
MLDAFAHAAGHGPHPGRYRPKPEDTKEGPADTKPREKNQEKKPQETLEEFCKRVGIKLVRGERGGVEFCPYHDGNLLRKRPKQRSKD